jgi:hypothetical protein
MIVFKHLLIDNWFNPKDGPIFFYAGNEADIVTFWNNTGFLFDIAPSFQALIVFGEHVIKRFPIFLVYIRFVKKTIKLTKNPYQLIPLLHIYLIYNRFYKEILWKVVALW